MKAGTGVFTLSGTNTYTGTTNVNGGTLQLSGGEGIAGTDVLVLDNTAGVTLDVISSETIGSLAGGGTTGGVVTDSTATAVTLTTGGNNTSTTFAVAIQNGSGTVALTKAGTGVFTLSGTNTYTGTTNVNFFFNDTATTEIYTLSLHDALPISAGVTLDVISSETIGSLAGGGTTGGVVTDS